MATNVTLAIALVVLGGGVAFAQQAGAPSGGVLEGTVRDESGGRMRAVVVQVFSAGDEEPSARPVGTDTTDVEGRFSIALPSGTYRVEVDVQAFAPFEQTVTVGPGSGPRPLDIVLAIDLVGLTVDVRPADELRADTTASLTSTTIAGDDLLDLPRSERDLAVYLLQLAGGDVTGDLDQDISSTFIIDGFEGGRLPNPDRIAQIVVDPNSLRADGQGPRIEIVTKPGTGEWRGSVDVGFADESLNARRPGEMEKEPRQTRNLELEGGGPLVQDLLEVSLELSDESDERAAESLRAITPSGEILGGVVQPESERELEAGATMQLNPSHRLDVRFARDSGRASNRGVGGFSLPERGSELRASQWMFQVSERTFRPGLNNNVRFQVNRRLSEETPLQQGFAIDVVDAFRAGGATAWRSSEEIVARLDDVLRWTRGDWNFEWEGQLEYRTRTSVDRDNYNGTFEFSSLHDYCAATGFAGISCSATARIVGDALAADAEPVYLDASDRQIPITGRPITFTQAFGNAELSFDELSFDTHVQADRRMGENASLGLGLQYTATSHSQDFLRFNPMIRAQYRLSRDTMLSGGMRLQFQDFTDYERLLRNDGSTYETELSISSPSFPDPFQGGTLAVGAQTASLWVLDPEYQSPYTLSPQVSLTHQVPGNVRLTLSYDASYGTHQRRTRNINAPAPGTPLPDDILDLPSDEQQEVVNRMRPMYPHVGNVTQIESTGRSVSRRVRVQVRPRGSYDRFGLSLSGMFDYDFRIAHDDNDFNNAYAREWGPSRREHQVQARFRIGLPEQVAISDPLARALARGTYENVNLNFQIRANTGRLYSISSGRDLNGDQSTRDRPPGVGRNTEVGPASWDLDLTLTKDFEFGAGAQVAEQRSGGDGGSRRGVDGGGPFNETSGGTRLRFQARVDNLFNHTQARAYGSVLTSPLFGLPTGYSGGRTIGLSLSVDF
jgi:hypothetical protein